MKIQNFRLLTIGLILLIVVACNPNSKRENNSKKNKLIQNGKLDIKVEIKKWKQELLENKQIGSPCYYRKTLDSLDCINWYKNNPNQQDGLPFDE